MIENNEKLTIKFKNEEIKNNFLKICSFEMKKLLISLKERYNFSEIIVSKVNCEDFSERYDLVINNQELQIIINYVARRNEVIMGDCKYFFGDTTANHQLFFTTYSLGNDLTLSISDKENIFNYNNMRFILICDSDNTIKERVLNYFKEFKPNVSRIIDLSKILLEIVDVDNTIIIIEKEHGELQIVNSMLYKYEECYEDGNIQYKNYLKNGKIVTETVMETDLSAVVDIKKYKKYHF